MPLKPMLSRAPLSDASFAPLPYTAVLPKGRLLKQLAACIHWAARLPLEEKMPDCLIALAFLCEDEELLSRAKAWVERMVSSQREDGSFGDAQKLDLQAHAIQGLISYYETVPEKEVLLFLLRYFQHVYRQAEALFGGGKNAILVGEYASFALALYERTGKAFLLHLMEKLRAYGPDWTGFFHTFPISRPFSKHISRQELEQGLHSSQTETKNYYERQQFFGNGIALAAGLKTPALFARFSGNIKEKEAGRLGLQRVMRHHGLANGMFTADEFLQGGDPSRGIDSRAITQMIASLESLVCLQGYAAFADAWEKIALNALPAIMGKTGTRPMQRLNQPYTMEEKVHSDETDEYAAASYLRGLTKYSSRLWMAAPKDGLAILSYMPATVRWRIGGSLATLEVTGNYPYEEEIAISLRIKKPASFPLHLRIPAWAKDACVRINDEGGESPEPGSFFIIDRTWQNGDTIFLSLPMEPRLTVWHHQSMAVEYGPLVMALPISSEEPLWNAAIVPEEPIIPSLEGKENGIAISIGARRVLGWTKKDGLPASPSVLPKTQEETLRLTLVPYGDTENRMTQLPQAGSVDKADSPLEE